VPEGWEKAQIETLCEEIKDSANPNELDPETPPIGLEHIPRRSITLSDWAAAGNVTSTKRRYVADDILFAKIRPYFHKVGIALADGVTSSDAIVLRTRVECRNDVRDGCGSASVRVKKAFFSKSRRKYQRVQA